MLHIYEKIRRIAEVEFSDIVEDTVFVQDTLRIFSRMRVTLIYGFPGGGKVGIHTTGRGDTLMVKFTDTIIYHTVNGSMWQPFQSIFIMVLNLRKILR